MAKARSQKSGRNAATNCWMCSPDTFPWDKYGSVEEAAGDWGEWYGGMPQPAPVVDDDADEREAQRSRAMASYHAAHSGRVPRAGR